VEKRFARSIGFAVAVIYLVAGAKVVSLTESRLYWPPAYLWWAVVLLPLTVILALSKLRFSVILGLEAASVAIVLLSDLVFSDNWKDMLAGGYFVEGAFIDLIVLVQGLALQLAVFGLIRLITRVLLT
jgi:hypothetical protein